MVIRIIDFWLRIDLKRVVFQRTLGNRQSLSLIETQIETIFKQKRVEIISLFDGWHCGHEKEFWIFGDEHGASDKFLLNIVFIIDSHMRVSVHGLIEPSESEGHVVQAIIRAVLVLYTRIVDPVYIVQKYRI